MTPAESSQPRAGPRKAPVVQTRHRPRQRRGITRSTLDTDSTIDGEQCVLYAYTLMSTSTPCRLMCRAQRSAGACTHPMTMPRTHSLWRASRADTTSTSSETRHNTIDTDSTIDGEQCVLYAYTLMSTSTPCRLMCKAQMSAGAYTHSHDNATDA
jgi:hypothetical protein